MNKRTATIEANNRLARGKSFSKKKGMICRFMEIEGEHEP